jgi:hypothetical protein
MIDTVPHYDWYGTLVFCEPALERQKSPLKFPIDYIDLINYIDLWREKTPYWRGVFFSFTSKKKMNAMRMIIKKVVNGNDWEIGFFSSQNNIGSQGR